MDAVVSGGGARCFIRASCRDGDVVGEGTRERSPHGWALAVRMGQWNTFDPSGDGVGWLESGESACRASYLAGEDNDTPTPPVLEARA